MADPYDKRKMSPKLAAGLSKLNDDLENRQELQDAEDELALAEETEEEVAVNPLAVYDEYNFTNSPIDNPHVRKDIEGRCEPMDIMDLILNNKTTQQVPISAKGNITVTYRSLTSADQFFIQEQAAELNKANWVTQNWIGYATVAFALVSVNGHAFPSVYDKEGTPTAARLEKKLAKVMAFPHTLLELVTLNYRWFQERIESLFQEDIYSGEGVAANLKK